VLVTWTGQASACRPSRAWATGAWWRAEHWTRADNPVCRTLVPAVVRSQGSSPARPRLARAVSLWWAMRILSAAARVSFVWTDSPDSTGQARGTAVPLGFRAAAVRVAHRLMPALRHSSFRNRGFALVCFGLDAARGNPVLPDPEIDGPSCGSRGWSSTSMVPPPGGQSRRRRPLLGHAARLRTAGWQLRFGYEPAAAAPR